MGRNTVHHCVCYNIILCAFHRAREDLSRYVCKRIYISFRWRAVDEDLHNNYTCTKILRSGRQNLGIIVLLPFRLWFVLINEAIDLKKIHPALAYSPRYQWFRKTLQIIPDHDENLTGWLSNLFIDSKNDYGDHQYDDSNTILISFLLFSIEAYTPLPLQLTLARNTPKNP